MLKWKKRSGRYSFKHVAETTAFEFEVEKQITEGFKKKHWHLKIIRKHVLGANRVALYEKMKTVRLARDRAGEFLKSDGAN